MPTVLITGAGSGIGKAAAERFARGGWYVFAGTRKPKEAKFAEKGIEASEIDVKDRASIATCFKKIPSLDCLVNNAGWGLLRPFEDTKSEEIEEMFRTNVLGLMDVTRAALPRLKKSRGIIVNIASIAGRRGSPLYSVYCSTKFAVEGFSETLAYELRTLGVTVKIVEPGRVASHFFDRAYGDAVSSASPVYRPFVEKKAREHEASITDALKPEDVADVIFTAATDGSSQLRYPLGKDTEAALKLKRELTDQEFIERIYLGFSKK